MISMCWQVTHLVMLVEAEDDLNAVKCDLTELSGCVGIGSLD